MARQTYAAESVSKAFSGVRALDFELRHGEIHALLGEKGSGSGTLIRILGGVLRPTAGEILVDGKAVALSSPRRAQRAGLGIVHQDLIVFPSSTSRQTSQSPPDHQCTPGRTKRHHPPASRPTTTMMWGRDVPVLHLRSSSVRAA